MAWATLASVHPQTGASELNNTGNMASASLDGSATITTFTHDGMNRMASASKDGISAEYEYDLDDRRSKKTVTTTGPEVVTRTLWSGTDELASMAARGCCCGG